MGEREVDQLLVDRAQHGDKHAFELLVTKYQRRLARLISRFVRDSVAVEDVTQEAFIKLIAHCLRFAEKVRSTLGYIALA